MSYYNPEVYDPKKLLGEDAAVMELSLIHI